MSDPSEFPVMIRTAFLTFLTAVLSTAVACAPMSQEGEGKSVSSPGEKVPPPAGTGTEPPPLPTDRPLNVAFLIVDGVYNTELTAPFDIFHHVRFHSLPGMEVFTVSPDGEAVTTFEGLVIDARYGFADAPAADVLVVPSAEHNMDSDLQNDELISWVREAGEQARWVISLCDGAFLLAQAGLLDGHSCTTFPGDQDRFAELFPHLDLRRGVSYVHDGKVLTSVGGAKSFEVAMYFADYLYGEAAAKGIGRGMVIDWPPSGTQP